MLRLLPLAVLIGLAAAPVAQADEGLVNGLPCNRFCRNWLGLAKAEPEEVPVAPQARPEPVREGGPPPAAAEPPAAAASEPPRPVARDHGRSRPRLRFAHANRPPLPVARPEPVPVPPPRAVPAPAPVLAKLEGRGGYPSGIAAEAVPAETSVVAQTVSSPPAPASWEQTALRIFEAANEPIVAPAAPQTPRRKSRHRP
jgi:hypothetical protein